MDAEATALEAAKEGLGEEQAAMLAALVEGLRGALRVGKAEAAAFAAESKV